MKNIAAKITIFFALISITNLSAQCWSGIANAHYSSTGITADGKLWAWGSGILGTETSSALTPTQVGTDTNWQWIGANYWHRIAQKSDGTIWGWGNNDEGQIGQGYTNYAVETPTQIGTANDWAYLNVAINTTFGIKTDGTLWGWGDNYDGQFGNGTSTNHSATPLQLGTETNWAKIAGGSEHTIAIKTGGSLWAWGQNSHGQLGDGTTTARLTPVQIGLGYTWKQVAAGEHYCVAIRGDNTLWAWGFNNFGQLGDGTYATKAVPVQIGVGLTFSKIVAGHSHTLAITTGGELYAWGRGNWGQLGVNNNYTTSVPQHVGTDTDWSDVAVGYDHSVALKTDGSVWAWGYNVYGQVGNGMTIDVWSPLLINCPNLQTPEADAGRGLTLSPNPANAFVDISSAASVERYELYDLQGRLLAAKNVSGENIRIDISSLQKATYIVNVFTAEGNQTVKIIKQ